MANLIATLKSNGIQLPMWMGQLLAYIPFGWRPMVGSTYTKRQKDIENYEKMSIEERQKFIFDKMYSLVEYAIGNIEFYKDFYAKKGFELSMLKSFDDIQKIPVISKSDLLEYEVEKRTNMSAKKFIQNTGGSSGHTLTFYVQPDQVGNEWAHIHKMWSLLGFKPSDLRLFMVGRSKVRGGADYEFARHVISLDMYKPYTETAPILKKKLKKHPVYYLHGYPSVMADFAKYCETDTELLGLLKSKLKGAFLNSEFPYPIYRDVIERVFNIRTQSFFGHTERSVMAYESDKKFRYVPFQTYGYAEALKNEEGHYDLIGTSYYNMASPLIRYNTKDIIDNPSHDGGIMTAFDIFEGRSGQFVVDKNGRQISLTGLVMGRHHGLFDLCQHIQIGQLENGKATIFYVPKDGKVIENVEQQFDSSNVDIDFSFVKLNEPIRTIAGKVNLLVLPQLMKEYISK